MKGKLIYISSYLLMIIFCVVLLLNSAADLKSDNADDFAYSVDFIGEYSFDNITYNDLDNIRNLPDLENVKVYLRGHFSMNIEQGQLIMMKIRDHSLSVCQNSYGAFEIISDPDDATAGLPFRSHWVSFMSDGIKATDTVTFIIKGSDISETVPSMLSSIHFGSKNGLFYEQLQKNIFSFSLSIFFIIAGVTYAVTVLIFIATNKEHIPGFISCGLFMIAGGISTALNYNYISLLTGNMVVLNVIDFITQLFLCLTLMHYLAAFISSPKKKLISSVIIYLFVGSCFVYIILKQQELITMSDFLSILIPAVISLAVLYEVFLFTEFIRTRDRKTLAVSISVIVLSLSLVIEHTIFSRYSDYAVIIFQAGLVVFIGIQYFVFLNHVRERLAERQSEEEQKNRTLRNTIALAMSYIDPQLLSDSASRIKELCDTDREETKHMLDCFSKYITESLSSMSEIQLTTLNEELEYTRCFLELTKIRFGDRLAYSYDLEVEDFKTPRLTVQSIVKNACEIIKLNENASCVLKIATRESIDSIAIIVTTTIKGEVDKSITLPNADMKPRIDFITENLKRLCSATIDYKPAENLGAVVTIKISKSAIQKSE